MTDMLEIRGDRVVIRCEPRLTARLNRIADTHYEGNRSHAIRQAIRELIERTERLERLAQVEREMADIRTGTLP